MVNKHKTFTPPLHLIKPTGAILLVIHLFIALTYTFFLHTHTLENGDKIVHSHPIAQSESRTDAHHTHHNSVYQILPDLQKYIEQSTLLGVFLITLLFATLTIQTQRYLSKTNYTPSLRGPPAFLS